MRGQQKLQTLHMRRTLRTHRVYTPPLHRHCSCYSHRRCLLLCNIVANSALNGAKHRIPKRTKGVQPPRRKTDRRELELAHKVMVVTMRVYGKMSMGAISKELEDHGIHFAKSSVESLLKRIETRAAEKGVSIFDLSIYQNNAGRGRKEALSDVQKDFLATFIQTDESTRKLDSRHILERLPSDFPRVHQSTLESTLYERGLLRKDGYWRSNPALDRELGRLLSAYNHSPAEPALFDGGT